MGVKPIGVGFKTSELSTKLEAEEDGKVSGAGAGAGAVEVDVDVG